MKFFQNREKIKESHPHILDLFDSETSREVKTEIIDNCFKKEGRQWKFDLDKPYFKESKQRSDSLCVCVGES